MYMGTVNLLQCVILLNCLQHIIGLLYSPYL